MDLTMLHKTCARRIRLSAKGASEERQARTRQALTDLAHDLRNGLNGILLMAQLLEELDPSPDAVRIAGRIQRQCQEMSEKLNNAMEIVGE